ncbi:3-hydroxyacyl-CoA dehydrogenase [Corynebacterium pseudopelargi]|uniref:Putative 3-hydroxybutyryl-CoA dehydrogenase n=1 Tax=Corynebacterium pseudopelargi TaxID=2080757 RepID=A0A3G6IY46_9CORY|nr:3-hydroxyacyl-CoA dehydrogenase [Corynebacterium pseudopelargi]AZA09050.1 putative 3-hydroxybutyryl-CoA dehydrogenase [Corynebacterium pseudopelargi]
MQSLDSVLITGGGTLGAQSALQFALHGKKVTIYGRSEDSIARAKQRVERFRTPYTQDTEFDASAVAEAIESIDYTTQIERAGAVDIVFECVAETTEAKTAIYKAMRPHLQPETIVATNSSTVLPSHLAPLLPYEAQFVAIHFANEIWKRPAAEIMGHPGTDAGVFEQAKEFAAQVGMVPLPIFKERSGYILNSLLIPFVESALELWGAGVSDPKTIDKTWEIVMDSLGPFKVLDVIGMRTVYAVLKSREAKGIPGTGELAQVVMRDYIEQGRLGVEAGAGFYDYDEQGQPNVD